MAHARRAPEDKQAENSLNEQAIAEAPASGIAAEAPADAKLTQSSALTKSVTPPYLSQVDNKESKIDEEPMLIDKISSHDVLDIILSYTADPVAPQKVCYPPQASFYYKTITQRLREAADDLLLGNGDRAKTLVTENPWVLKLETDGYDRFGTCIEKRTLLQIAAMMLDVNHCDKQPGEEKDHGMVEQLKKAGGLSDEDVAGQLHPILFSDIAIAETKARKDAILAVIKTFGESLISRRAELPEKYETDAKFMKAQEKCQSEIHTMRSALIEHVSNKKITHGLTYIPRASDGNFLINP